ncbi:MAG: small subunit ribosomal protein [Candidatus Woesearchaeota archaeon]|nr:small subunit ribosomal protein [Candidatus Woesearchaeota archaeon]MDK2907983.1 small subunit ribosomal protein [Candidatus Woesearchaeota archaeon]
MRRRIEFNSILWVLIMDKTDKRTEKSSMKHIVRIGRYDIPGNMQVMYGLTNIKGIGKSLSSAICNSLGIDKTTKVGILEQDQIEKLNDAVFNPAKYGIPSFMLNNQKDFETGEDMHIIGQDIDIKINQIKNRHMKLKSYKGTRYPKRLTVRGQRTRSNFRRNKGKVTGVSKKKNKASAEKK